MKDKKIGERHGHLTIIARSLTKKQNGYLRYYWVRCDCGNIKRYRYDQIRRVGDCGMCEDFRESEVLKGLEGIRHGKE